MTTNVITVVAEHASELVSEMPTTSELVSATPTTSVVYVATGAQGPPGLPGESVIAGHTVVVSNLSTGDHIEFTGLNWANIHKTTLSDGGNF